MTLYEITEEFQKLEDLLMTGEVTEESEALLNQLMTAEGSKLDGYLMVYANLKMMEEGAKNEAARLAKKAKTAAAAIDSMKGRLAAHFALTGTKSVTRPLGKIVLKSSQGAVELDVSTDEIPEEYTVTKTVTTINKKHLKDCLKSDMPGLREDASKYAHIEEGKQYIQIY